MTMETNHCYSLSGYLSLKPVGALSVVLPTRRYWCTFNETRQTLELFHSERDLNNRKVPAEQLLLRRSAISLSNTEERVLVILTNNKEYHLQADNHEALMIWLLGLQAKRDSSMATRTFDSSLGIDGIPHACLNYGESWIAMRSRSSTDEVVSRRDSILDPIDGRRFSSTSNTSAHLCETCLVCLCVHCRAAVNRSGDLSAYRTRSSSRSMESTDSAFSDQRLFDSPDGLQETLLTLKCELDSLLNKENVYQMVLREKSEMIRQLEAQLVDLAQSQSTSNKHQTMTKIFHDRCRETNNELKFLQCEISQLYRVICDDDLKIRRLIKAIRVQEAQRESLQRDYLFLLQTVLSTDDGRLFGGTKHRERLKELLSDCRKRDPSLPTFDSLEGSGVYIDSYGFKHEKSNETDRLQYICVKLTHFYDSKSHGHNDHVWRSLLKSFQTKALKHLVRQGIPVHLRSELWRHFIQKRVHDIRQAKDTSYFQHLCHLLTNANLNPKFEKQIALDLNRTMPRNIRFSSKDSEGIRQLRQVLQAFCLHNPAIGYCQGMNFIVAVALLLVEPEDSFWLLVAMTECYLHDYYDMSLLGAQVDQYVLKDLLKEKAPDIYEHFERNEVEITSLTFNWFMAIFIDSVPFESLLRIWDCFLLEGAKVLFRFAVAILILNRESILHRTDTISIIRHIKDSTKNLIDIERLFHIAFEDLKPFCHRKEIASKQAYWRKILLDKYIKRRASKEEAHSLSPTLDCAVVLPGGRAWVAFGSQFTLHLFEVDVERGFMIDLDITYTSRAFCMACVSDQQVLVGTLCGSLLGFPSRRVNCPRKMQWSIQLGSCLLCMLTSSQMDFHRIYCGLSDGNLAIVDQLYDEQEPKEAFCISIDKTSITGLAAREERLWCLTLKKFTIVNEKTLDILSCIDFTCPSIDATALLYCEDDHAWILHRSPDNILQVWNQSSCRLQANVSLNRVFDRIGKTIEQLTAMEATSGNDDVSSSYMVNQIRVTAFLIHEKQIWIGTSTGILFLFDYDFQWCLKTIPLRKRRPRSMSLGNPRLDDKQVRFRSDSALVSDTKRCQWKRQVNESSTTLTSVRTRSSSLSRLSSDDEGVLSDGCRRGKGMEASTSATMTFNLTFKAMIADSPVKSICKIQCHDQTMILTCAGKLGDDEIVCRWRQIPQTSQWTNDAIVELNAETMLPIRPLYGHQQRMKDQLHSPVSK